MRTNLQNYRNRGHISGWLERDDDNHQETVGEEMTCLCRNKSSFPMNYPRMELTRL